MQAYIEEDNGQRLIFLEGESTRMRVATEEVIKNMSDGSLRSYRDKIRSWSDRVHEHGTPEAIKAIDYLRHAVKREYEEARKLHHPAWRKEMENK